MKSSRRPNLQIEVHSPEKESKVDSEWIRRIADTILKGEKSCPQGSLSIILVDDVTIQDLNRRFLDKDRPTDVMAFPLDDDEVWGEIYIGFERARNQADTYHVSFQKELARLIIHGVLHLTGYSDSNTRQSKIMTNKEDGYLQILHENHLL
jgi:probable rRNA maturation factor